jgi:ankyrin repeat protein
MSLTLAPPTLPQRKGSMYGSTALIIASTKGYTETVNILISAGADLNAKATVHSFRQLVVIIISTFVFFYLHVKGGWTALMTACLKDHCGVVHLLTAAGADVDALTDVSDRDSLHHTSRLTHQLLLPVVYRNRTAGRLFMWPPVVDIQTLPSSAWTPSPM